MPEPTNVQQAMARWDAAQSSIKAAGERLAVAKSHLRAVNRDIEEAEMQAWSSPAIDGKNDQIRKAQHAVVAGVGTFPLREARTDIERVIEEAEVAIKDAQLTIRRVEVWADLFVATTNREAARLSLERKTQ